ncbi:MAG: hypothetical protein LBE13_14690, partial [Bacteroidales bacterium]|nr:hypothetical protein [Bacteroidales bacterium]
MNFNIAEHRDIVDLSRPIIVSMESFADLKDAAVISDDGLYWNITFMYFDQDSRNNNYYPADDVRRSVEESFFVQENLRNRTWFGETEHPPADAPLSRFLFIEPARYAWNILSFEYAGDCYKGKIGLCAPLGTSIILPNIKQFGSNYASSCRIYTPNYIEKEMNGKKIYIKKYKMYPVTFDCVTTPGYRNCRAADPNTYSPSDIKTSESLNIIKFDNPADELLKMMKSSENCRILEDYFKIDLGKQAILLKDNKIKLSSENGVSVITSLD